MIGHWLRFLAGTGCLCVGLFFMVSAVVGNYRFHFSLNRMHAAALGDTLGLLGVVAGVCFYEGLAPVTLKLLMVIVLMWITSPVSSHLIMLMELTVGRYSVSQPSDEQGMEAGSIELHRHALAQERKEDTP